MAVHTNPNTGWGSVAIIGVVIVLAIAAFMFLFDRSTIDTNEDNDLQPAAPQTTSELPSITPSPSTSPTSSSEIGVK